MIPLNPQARPLQHILTGPMIQNKRRNQAFGAGQILVALRLAGHDHPDLARLLGRPQDELLGLEAYLAEVERGINAEVFYPNDNFMCGICGYCEFCGEW